MRNLILLIFVAFIIPWTSTAQTPQYLIKLRDKNGTPYSVSKPGEFLSPRSIERRARQQIPVVENDLPVNPAYLDSIRSVENVTIRNVSKWLNQVCIETNDATALDKISAFTFVLSSRQVRRQALLLPELKNKLETDLKESAGMRGGRGVNGLDYGVSSGQITIHKGNFLHDKGYRGQGVLISVIDAGFTAYKSLPAFDSVRNQGRIIDTYDFVANKTEVNDAHSHGMYCFSIIVANAPGQMIGSAPNASFLLYRSEDGIYESPAEEQNWVVAAERSDSAGADIITTSLGYTTFDNPIFNHTYADMDGKTTIMAKGAAIAATKGMILLNAAGNDGNKPWHYIGTPADAIGTLSVGAVDINGNPGVFSSYGPSADGRQKPEVSSVGVATFVQGPGGTFVSGNGTSFATPNLAGLVACLWQAFPEFSSVEIMDYVIRSSNHYTNPDYKTGYGIPDFELAFTMLEKEKARRFAEKVLNGGNIAVYPNPFANRAQIAIKPVNSGEFSVMLYDITGKLCYSSTEVLVAGEPGIVSLQRPGLARGVYILKVQNGQEKYVHKVLVH